MEDRAISLNAVIDVMHEMWGDSGELLDAIKELPSATPQFIPIEGDGFEKTLPKEMDGCWALFTDGKQISIERWKLDTMNHFYPGGEKFSFQEAKGYYPLPKMDLLKLRSNGEEDK